jgi:hypothetical protein
MKILKLSLLVVAMITIVSIELYAGTYTLEIKVTYDPHTGIAERGEGVIEPYSFTLNSVYGYLEEDGVPVSEAFLDIVGNSTIEFDVGFAPVNSGNDDVTVDSVSGISFILEEDKWLFQYPPWGGIMQPPPPSYETYVHWNDDGGPDQWIDIEALPHNVNISGLPTQVQVGIGGPIVDVTSFVTLGSAVYNSPQWGHFEVTPEPATLFILGPALLGIFGLLRKRKNR